MNKGDKIAIVCCSNGQRITNKGNVAQFVGVLEKIGLVPVSSSYIYEKDSVFSGTAEERAIALMDFYKDDSIQAIFDISGGDIANEILPYLDFGIIRDSNKSFWGYSDLTTILNAIYTKTGKESVLYQVRNILEDNSDSQLTNFTNYIYEKNSELTSFHTHFLQGSKMEGVVVGGNMRCLTKLAGTEYWPDMHGKILFLEGLSGSAAVMTTLVSQLQQLRVFDQVAGIVLGTFTEMEKKKYRPSIEEIVLSKISQDTPLAKTKEIGHGIDSKAMVIGRRIIIRKGNIKWKKNH